jgi:hypothetical protein
MSEQEPGGFIVSAAELTAKIQQWKAAGWHVLTPAIRVTSFAVGYGVNASLVELDSTIDDRGRGLDVYFDKNTLKDDERGLSKIGLGKIASCAGVNWMPPPNSGRRDGYIHQNLWVYQIMGTYLSFDGSPQTIHGEKEIDYRDGSAQIGGWTPRDWQAVLDRSKTDKNVKFNINGWSESRVRTARMNGAERAETGAMERAIRMGFGIKHAYTIKELQKPFVALRVVAIPDMTDPGVRRRVLDRQLDGAAALFGNMASSRGLPEAPSQVIDIPLTRRDQEVFVKAIVAPPEPTETLKAAAAAAPATEPRASGQAPSPEKAAAEEQLPDGAFYIKECRTSEHPYSKTHRKHGQMFKKWTIVSDGGEEGTTVFAKWGEVADTCFKDGLPVTWTLGETNSFNEREILNLARAAQLEPK